MDELTNQHKPCQTRGCSQQATKPRFYEGYSNDDICLCEEHYKAEMQTTYFGEGFVFD